MINEDDTNAVYEIADVVIVLYRIVQNLGRSLQDAIDEKMMVNRNRRWKLDGKGQGYHVKWNKLS